MSAINKINCRTGEMRIKRLELAPQSFLSVNKNKISQTLSLSSALGIEKSLNKSKNMITKKLLHDIQKMHEISKYKNVHWDLNIKNF